MTTTTRTGTTAVYLFSVYAGRTGRFLSGGQHTEDSGRRKGLLWCACFRKRQPLLSARGPAGCVRWEFLYVHFRGEAALPFFDRIRQAFGPCSSICLADSRSRPSVAEPAPGDSGRGGQLKSYEGGELVLPVPVRPCCGRWRPRPFPSPPRRWPAALSLYEGTLLPGVFPWDELAARLGLSAA